MRNKLTSLVIGTALVGTLAFGTGVSAEQIEVQKGDTLWNIAQENGTSVDVLMDLNDLTSSIIQPTQTLETSTKSEEKNKETFYKVKSGDTLSGISLEYGVKVNELKDWNDLDSDLITVNQKLLIKGIENETATEQVEPKKESTKAVEKEEQPEPVQEETPKAEKQTEEQPQKSSEAGQSMTMEATAYTAECYGCSGVTATGIDLNADRNKKVIAVDPSVIPLGSRVHVEGYGEAIAGDTGGAIKGNRIDLHMPTKGAANNFGRQSVNITVLD